MRVHIRNDQEFSVSFQTTARAWRRSHRYLESAEEIIMLYFMLCFANLKIDDLLLYL